MSEINENEYVVRTVKYCILGVLVVVAILFGSCQTTKYRIVQAVEAGASAVEAECALASNSSYGCMLIYDATAEKIRSQGDNN